MEGYSVKIAKVVGLDENRLITARERLKMKDFSNALSLDEVTQGGNFVFSPDYYAVLEVDNEKSEDKHYQKFVIIAKDGTKIVTGSQSFITSLAEIMNEMAGTGEDYEVECFRKPSANYKGKEFLTCSII